MGSTGMLDLLPLKFRQVPRSTRGFLSIPRGSTEDISDGPTPASSWELRKHRQNTWLGHFGRGCFAPRLSGEQEETRNSFHSPQPWITPSLTEERFPSQGRVWSKGH